MTIKRVEFKNKKPHLRYDPATKSYIGWQTDIRGQNGKRLRPTFRTKTEAEKFVDAIRENRPYVKAGLPTPVGQVRVADLFAARLKKITNPKEIVRAQRVFKEFAFIAPPLVSAVTTADFQEYINSRDDVKPQTIDREVTALSTAFKQAREMFPRELGKYKPPEIARPKYRKVKRKQRVITAREKDMIIRSILTDRLPKEHTIRTISRPVVALMFELAWFLGLRYSEAKYLLKTDFNGETLRVVRTKTGDVTILEFLPERVLEILTTDSHTDYIFNVPCSDHTFAAIIRDGFEANGIIYGRDANSTFHSTRHSFVTRMMEVADLPTTQAYSAHSDKEMVAYYSHSSAAKRKAAMEKMYGSGRRDLLLKIYEKVVAGEMDFEAFFEALK